MVLVLAVALPAAAHAADPEAPPDSPAHWLPGETWVSNHWLPYDERRLHRLLKVERIDIWRQLRDDRRSIAQMARRKGWRPSRLATALVAPWRGKVSARRLALLRSRALRTLTQGHMAQHIFFHSLHQFAVPQRARFIFGVRRDRFTELRRQELSPLQIGMLYGRSPGQVQAAVMDTLRARARAGVRTESTPPAQAGLLLSRQLSQVPRWLQQARYNGPPKTHHHGSRRGQLLEVPRNYATNPALSADGTHVVYEGYEQRLPLLLRFGEINVYSSPPSGLGARMISAPLLNRPRSAYNATTSADGRFVAFELANGNLNFGKRYGSIHVQVRDTRGGAPVDVTSPAVRAGQSRSVFNPSLSGDGRRLAFAGAAADGHGVAWVRDLSTGATTLATPRPPGEPAGDAHAAVISGDGGHVAYTWVPRTGAISHVYVCGLAAGTTTLVDRAPGAAGAVADSFSSQPALSHDGRRIAFSSAAGNLGAGAGGVRVYVRDLSAGTTVAAGRSGSGAGFHPTLSADGGRVAFVSGRAGHARILVGDVARGTVLAVSGGATEGIALDPSLSADGQRVAFSSTRRDLAPRRSRGPRAVYVRDLSASRTALVSDGPD